MSGSHTQSDLRLRAAPLAGGVQGVGEPLVTGGQPMRVPAQRGAGVGVTELRADIGDWMTLGQMDRRERITGRCALRPTIRDSIQIKTLAVLKFSHSAPN